MISVIRNKRTGHVSAPGSKAYKERQEKEEAKRQDEVVQREHDHFYIYGRRMPTQDGRDD